MEPLNHQKSFTMIELLVVIAIIGLIASVVLVSFGGQRQKARITKVLEFSQQVHRVMGSDTVGWWDFDEGSGTTAKDSSGYGNNGTISGATYTSDTPYNEVGQGSGKYALSFDGVDDGVDLGNPPSLYGMPNLTITAWAKRNAAATGGQDHMVTNWTNSYHFILNGNRLEFDLFNEAGVQSPSTRGTTVVQNNTWYFFCCHL